MTTILLILIAVAFLVWDTGAQSVTVPPPVNQEIWVGRITAIGSAMVAIITALGTTFFLWIKFKELSHHVNSKMDEFLRVVDAAAYARGQISGTIKPEIKSEAGSGLTPITMPPEKTIQAAKETVIAASKTAMAIAAAAEQAVADSSKP